MIRAVDKWLCGYLKSELQRPKNVEGLKHLVFCLADHFEPFRGDVSKAQARDVVRKWCDEYPAAIDGFTDTDGKSPQHTFFYPEEDYDPVCLDLLADLCARSYGEVEVHMHHKDDTAEGFRRKLVEFRDRLHNDHGLLGCDESGLPRYGFIHGNWALCNSRPDGDWCGVNEELGILRETGCYADFTFPSAPSPTQPRIVNSIYYASDTPGQPRAHDHGIPVVAANHSSSTLLRQGYGGQAINHPPSPRLRWTGQPSTIPLMLIQGPLALNWRQRKWGILPRLENAEISGANPPTKERIRLWIRQHIHVKESPGWIFVKLHTHGCVEENTSVLMGDAIRCMHEHLSSRCDDGVNWQLHYVTAREMYNTVRALEDNAGRAPEAARNYEIAAPM